MVTLNDLDPSAERREAWTCLRVRVEVCSSWGCIDNEIGGDTLYLEAFNVQVYVSYASLNILTFKMWVQDMRYVVFRVSF